MEEKIEYLLSEVRKLIEDKPLDDLGIDFSKIDGEYFENVFKKKCEEILEKQEFQGIKLEDIRGHKFPDFILNYNNKNMESKLNQVKREIGPSLEIQFLKILQPTILKIFLYFLVALRKRKTLLKLNLLNIGKL